MSEPVIRNCATLEEFNACVALQKEVWGFADADLIPLRLFVVASKIGGQIIGAFDGDELAGFAMSIPGSRDGKPYLHSHMLAVRKGYQNAGLGRKLKLFQRDDALAMGHELIEWTFDPLEIKNAHLNLSRLGAIARRYNLNQYGYSSSPLQGGLPTDRLVAEWWLKSKHAQAVMERRRPEVEVNLRVKVPGEVYAWKADPQMRAQAAEVQSQNREAFLKAFSKGMAVVGFEVDEAGNGTYLLGPWREDR